MDRLHDGQIDIFAAFAFFGKDRVYPQLTTVTAAHIGVGGSAGTQFLVEELFHARQRFDFVLLHGGKTQNIGEQLAFGVITDKTVVKMYIACQTAFFQQIVQSAGFFQRNIAGNHGVLPGTFNDFAGAVFDLTGFIGNFFIDRIVIQIQRISQQTGDALIIFRFDIAGGDGNILTGHIADQQIAVAVKNFSAFSGNLFWKGIFLPGLILQIFVLDYLHPIKLDHQISEKSDQ